MEDNDVPSGNREWFENIKGQPPIRPAAPRPAIRREPVPPPQPPPPQNPKPGSQSGPR